MLVKPSLLRRLPTGLWGLIILSVGLHCGLLLLPMPRWWLTSTEPDPEEIVVEENDAIAVITLPKVSPKPAAVRAPAAVESPPPVQVPETLPAIDEIYDETYVDDAVLDDEPVEDITETTDDVENDAADIEPQPNEPEAGIAFQFNSDFPHLAGSQAGCYGLENCRTAEGQNYVDAVQEIRSRLEAQGYTLTLYEGNDDSDVRNHRIYEMRLPEDSDTEVKYLNVFGEGLKTAIYIITTRIVTQDELETLGAADRS